MTFIAAAWGVGLVIGPALGGLLAEPVRQYPDTFSGNGRKGEEISVLNVMIYAFVDRKGFLETFPYFLPSAVTASLVLFGVVLVYFFLPETLEKRFVENDASIYLFIFFLFVLVATPRTIYSKKKVLYVIVPKEKMKLRLA